MEISWNFISPKKWEPCQRGVEFKTISTELNCAFKNVVSSLQYVDGEILVVASSLGNVTLYKHNARHQVSFILLREL